jgi:hypothetical protein
MLAPPTDAHARHQACPDCGAATVIDPTAARSVWLLPRVWLRTSRPRRVLQACVLRHCSRCEWTVHVRDVGAVAR